MSVSAPHSPATLMAVAQRAGVSASTVSRFLSGKARLSAAARQAVEEAIAALDYRPNALAQSLKRGASMTIGVLTPAVDSPLLSAALLGIDQTLSAQGYVPLMACGHWLAQEEQKRIDLLLSQRVDGLIILSSALPDEALARLAARLPLMVIGAGAPAAWRLGVDNQQGAWQATQHLLSLGHRRIAHIAGPADRASARARLAGYRQAMQEAGLAPEPALIREGDWLPASGEQAVEHWLSQGQSFTAIFAANDQMAAGARLALYRHGLAVPGQVSLIGFDAVPASACMTPPLTTVDTHMPALGARAAELLVRRLRGESVSDTLLPPRLLVRESCAPQAQ